MLSELTGRHDEAAAGLVPLLESSPDSTIDFFLAYSPHNALYIYAFRRARVPERR